MCCFAKNKGIEDLKMHYQYTVIEYVCSSSTGFLDTRIPEECVTGIPSSNLFVAGVPVEKK